MVSNMAIALAAAIALAGNAYGDDSAPSKDVAYGDDDVQPLQDDDVSYDGLDILTDIFGDLLNVDLDLECVGKCTCKSCQDLDMVFCKGGSLLSVTDTCYPQALWREGGETCPFGSNKLGSKVDCTFNAKYGEVILALIIMLVLGCTGGAIFLVYMCRKQPSGPRMRVPEDQGVPYGGAYGAQPSTAPPAYGAPAGGTDSVEAQLTNLQSLKAQGMLTDEEYQAARKKALGI